MPKVISGVRWAGTGIERWTGARWARARARAREDAANLASRARRVSGNERPMSVASAPPCPACRSREGFTVFGAREMMFGTREKFEYRACLTCGSLHLATIPSDFGRFY